LPISAIDAISPAFRHAREQLLQPFRIGQWLRLALVGLLAGELTSGGCNGNFQLPQHRNHFTGLALPHIDPLAMAGLIAVLAAVGTVLWILFLYVSSVMRFILFDSVLQRRCEIRRGWNRRQKAGVRYFLWQLTLLAAMLIGMTILIGIPAAVALAAGWLTNPKQHLLPVILGGMVLFFVVFAFVLAVAVIHVLTKDFVVPHMALEDLNAFQAWNRLLPMLDSEKGPYIGYLLMKIVMALGVAVVVSIIAVIVILIMLIPVGGVGAAVVLAGKAAGLQWNLYTITLAVMVGCALLGVILYVISLISVPATVFFPAYSIYFFASRYPALGALVNPAPPPMPEPPLAPPLPGVSG
jgi:hypothetical protein